jgi:hypothetical protein
VSVSLARRTADDADALLVAKVDARIERENGRPVLVFSNRGAAVALHVQITLDGRPVEEHSVFRVRWREHPITALSAGEERHVRGVHYGGMPKTVVVSIAWTTAKRRSGRWERTLELNA